MRDVDNLLCTDGPLREDKEDERPPAPVLLAVRPSLIFKRQLSVDDVHYTTMSSGRDHTLTIPVHNAMHEVVHSTAPHQGLRPTKRSVLFCRRL